ncbi:MAG: cytochrome c3 family protein [Chloroflexi bacterium]|nr:cytochrome c3 family protein [Chloroflexota bacterium]
MSKLLDFLKNPGVQIGMLAAFLVLISAGAWGIYQTQIPPTQPIQFPHSTHVNLQIPCLYCHPGAWRQASAGLPTEQKCWACHGQLKKYFQPEVPVGNWPVELQKLNKYVQENKPIDWVPVYQVPDFVHFNHRPHIAAGLNCENCHGDMSKKTVATLEQTVNMGWCITCHKAKTENDVVKRTKLLDCSTCHY